MRGMSKKPERQAPEIEDEPGMAERFQRALDWPPGIQETTAAADPFDLGQRHRSLACGAYRHVGEPELAKIISDHPGPFRLKSGTPTNDRGADGDYGRA